MGYKPRFPPMVMESILWKIVRYREQGLQHQRIRQILEEETQESIPHRTYESWAKKAKYRLQDLFKDQKDVVIAEIRAKRAKLFEEAKARHISSKKGVDAIAVANRILESETRFLQDMGFLPSKEAPAVQVQNNVQVFTVSSWLKKKVAEYVESPDGSVANQG